MTKYSELQAKFLPWNKALHASDQRAWYGMVQFSNGLTRYLEAPDESVKLCGVSPRLDGLSKYTTASNSNDALSRDYDGAWRFGIEVLFISLGTFGTVEVDGASHPIPAEESLHLFFDIRMEVREGGFVFSNAEDSSSPHFSCKFDDSLDTMDSAYRYMSGILENVFELKPGERVEKVSLGFDLSGPRTKP